MGLLSAALVLLAFPVVLVHAGRRPEAAVSPGSQLYPAYRQVTTATFAALVACQVGTAFAARTEWASLRSVGFTSNRLLPLGIVGEVCFSATVVHWPPAQRVFGTAALPAWVLLLPFPVVVWGADELPRWQTRRRRARPGEGQGQRVLATAGSATAERGRTTSTGHVA